MLNRKDGNYIITLRYIGAASLHPPTSTFPAQIRDVYEVLSLSVVRVGKVTAFLRRVFTSATGNATKSISKAKRCDAHASRCNSVIS